MKFKIIVILSLLIMIASMIGCSSESAKGFILNPETITAIEEPQPTFNIETTSVKPKPPTPFEIKQKEDLLYLSSDLIYPARVECQVVTDYKYDKWLIDDFYPVLGHRAGEPLGVVIYNAQDKDCLFSLEYQTISAPHTDSHNGTTYQPAPYEATSWFNIQEKIVLLKAHELKTIPISFKIPLNYNTPDNWIAQIVVTNENTRGFVTGNCAVSYLITMVR